MRIGLAIDLHAPASQAAEVSWLNVREQVLAVERIDLDPSSSPIEVRCYLVAEQTHDGRMEAIGAFEDFVSDQGPVASR